MSFIVSLYIPPLATKTQRKTVYNYVKKNFISHHWLLKPYLDNKDYDKVIPLYPTIGY